MRWIVAMLLGCFVSAALAGPADALRGYSERLDQAVVDYYADPAAPAPSIALPADVVSALSASSVDSIRSRLGGDEDFPARVGAVRAALQQAIALKMADAVRGGDLEAAKLWRCELMLPRGVSAAEGSLFLATLGNNPDKRDEAARLLVREAITWQTSRVRQLLAEVAASASEPLPMPGRLRERLAEATTLADLPPELAKSAGLENYRSVDAAQRRGEIARIESVEWTQLGGVYPALRKQIETSLPSLLSDAERARRERLLLKLVMLIPREYASGTRDGKVTVPLEYREAVAFTAQARQILGELAPLWLAGDGAKQQALEQIERHLAEAETKIAAVAPSDDLEASLKHAQNVLTADLGINLARRGTTADIVSEVLLETHGLLSQSLAAALSGNWAEAEQRRLEAYTTYDPELEARLMPRDPQLATDIEHLLLDGLDQPGVKVLLDRRAGQVELEAAYARVNDALNRAGVQLKSGISPTAAAVNASSIVLREGLEGLLVIIAIFAGLRGPENAQRRRLFWVGVLGSVAATAVTWLLSETLITSLRSHGETIAAITGLVAIGVLLLITNWLFHQVYWRQWITTLKAQAVEGESVWALVTAGFAVGYREGFETVLFLQSLVLDAGGGSVAIGVGAGVVVLVVLGFASLRIGLKLPYFKLLMVTAVLIGLVLITFTGGTVRAMQTIGWVPVHQIISYSWPVWTGNWLGLYNTWESLGGQLLAASLVVGTWRIARFKAKRKSAQRKSAMAACRSEAESHLPISGCDPDACSLMRETPTVPVVQINVASQPRNASRPHANDLQSAAINTSMAAKFSQRPISKMSREI